MICVVLVSGSRAFVLCVSLVKLSRRPLVGNLKRLSELDIVFEEASELSLERMI